MENANSAINTLHDCAKENKEIQVKVASLQQNVTGLECLNLKNYATRLQTIDTHLAKTDGTIVTSLKELESISLKTNALTESKFTTQVQLKNLQDTVDKLLQTNFTLEQKLKGMEHNVHPTSYAHAKKRLVLHQTREGELLDQWIEENEKVLLVYPTTSDKDGNIWIDVRRVFDNGAVDDYSCIFFDKQSQTLLFENFSQ